MHDRVHVGVRNHPSNERIADVGSNELRATKAG
jgi:hypothetical protein